MIELSWDNGSVKDPVRLTDQIEMFVAFHQAAHLGGWGQAEFSAALKSETKESVPNVATRADQELLQLQDELGVDVLLTDEGEPSAGDEPPDGFDPDNEGGDYLQGEESDDLDPAFDSAVRLVGRRAHWLKSLYPFTVEGNVIKLVDNITKAHLAYLWLLACARHNQIDSLSRELEDGFEVISKEAMQQLFPDWAEVFLFSKNSADRKEMGSRAKDAVPVLAEKLNAETRDRDPGSSQKEFGIDIAAVCASKDYCGHPFFAFAQCTVTPEWWNKKHEAKARHALSAYVNIDTEHSNLVFTPTFPLSVDDSFSYSVEHLSDCTLYERYRICSLLQKSQLFENGQLPSEIQNPMEQIGFNALVN